MVVPNFGMEIFDLLCISIFIIMIIFYNFSLIIVTAKHRRSELTESAYLMSILI